MSRRLAAAAAALAAACGPAAPRPMPRIVGAWPTGEAVCPDEVVVAVEFSEPVDPAGVADGRFFALALEADLRQVVAGVEAPGGVVPGVPVVAGAVSVVAGGRRAELRPAAPLDPYAGYAAVVASQVRSADGRPVLDPTGRRRPFVSPFRTGPRPDREPPVPRWIRPPHGPVPANLAALRLGFGEPVSGALSLPGVGSTSPVAPAPDVLGLDLASDLRPGPLAPSLEGVADAAGNRPSDLAPVEVTACRDLASPAVAEAEAQLEVGETFLAVAARADEMVRLGLEVAAASGEGACGAAPAWPAAAATWSEPLACPGFDPCRPGAVTCPAAARVEGLCPGRRVAWRVLAEDLAGNLAAPGPWREALTAPPVARPVLSEVLVDAASPEEGGEYAEVANLGSGEADLAGWHLAKRAASGTWARCPLEALGGPVPPGGHGLVVGGAYDGRYRLDLPLFRCGSWALLGGLSNDEPPGLALEAPDGTAVSTIGLATPMLRCGDRSVERIHPAGPDEAANLACSRATSGTPGACNGVTPPEECPRRPW